MSRMDFTDYKYTASSVLCEEIGPEYAVLILLKNIIF